VPYPKTKLFNLCVQHGGLKEKDISWDDFTTTDYENMIYVNPNFTREELLKVHRLAYKKYYRNPKIVWANALKLSTFDQVKAYMDIFSVLKDFTLKRGRRKDGMERVQRRSIGCDIGDLML
jgi:hypothetical protein